MDKGDSRQSVARIMGWDGMEQKGQLSPAGFRHHGMGGFTRSFYFSERAKLAVCSVQCSAMRAACADLCGLFWLVNIMRACEKYCLHAADAVVAVVVVVDVAVVIADDDDDEGTEDGWKRWREGGIAVSVERLLACLRACSYLVTSLCSPSYIRVVL